MEEELEVEGVAVVPESQPPLQNKTLLGEYVWQTAAKGPEANPKASPGTNSKWRKIQSWTRSKSHPDTKAKGVSDESLGTAESAREPGPTAGAKRSVFRRALSAPARVAKEPGPRTHDSRGRIRKYFRSVSQRLLKKNVAGQGPEQEQPAGGTEVPPATHCMPLTPSSEVHVWDISNFTLLDGQLMLINRDEENTYRTRNRTGSCLSGSSLPHSCSPDEEEPSTSKNLNGPKSHRKSLDQETLPTNQSNNAKGLIWKRIKRSKPSSKSDLSVSSAFDGDRSQSLHGSHDSLSSPLSMVELLDISTEKNIVIRPLHSSILGEKFCFEIITPEGSRCFGCTSVEERDRWIENLRRTVQPNKDNCERVENTLSLWIYEAKDFSPKRKYFCELHLDGTLYARTTSKLNQGTLFWGEHFDFDNLPQVTEVTIHFLREGDRKKREPKELTPAGSVTIPLSDLISHQHVEKWYPVLKAASSKEKPVTPSIRVKGRYQNIHVLPIMQYKEFAEYISFNYMKLCAELEPSISVRDKEELASCLVHVLQSTGKAKSFLIDLGIAEVDRFDEKESLIFRENTLATKAIDEYMKLVGQKYLLNTIGEFIVQLYDSEDSCEVDPSKCSSNNLSDNQNILRQSCKEVFKKITDSCDSFPAELNEIFATWKEECRVREKVGIWQRLICASLFLRFLCPAIMSPSLFYITQEYPGHRTSRTLTLVAKVIQNLANFTTFGNKEAYMEFMNEFLEHNWENMKSFLHTVSSPESEAALSTYDGYIDLACELSILHTLLCGIVVTLDKNTMARLEPLPTILQAIQEGTPVPPGISTNPSAISSSEHEKPGFLAPKDLPKHSPLVTKSISMMSIQRSKGRDGERAFHGLLTSQSFTRTRRHIQRTQSVPAGNRALRMRKHSSTEHLQQPLHEEGVKTKPCLLILHPGGVTRPHGRPRMHQSASLPRRKSTVPWLRYPEEGCQANTGVQYSWSCERHEKLIMQLKCELQMTRERQQILESQVEALMGQIQALHKYQTDLQDSEQSLRIQLKQMVPNPVETNSRQPLPQEEKKRAQPEAAAEPDTVQRIVNLEDRLSIMEREHVKLMFSIDHPDGILKKKRLPLLNGTDPCKTEVTDNENETLPA